MPTSSAAVNRCRLALPQIAGFGGATVALAGGLIDKIVKAGDVAQALGLFFLVAAVFILGSSIYYAVLKGLKPVSRFALSSAEVANYLDDERFVTQAPQEKPQQSLPEGSLSDSAPVMRDEEANGSSSVSTPHKSAAFRHRARYDGPGAERSGRAGTTARLRGR